MEKNEIEKQIKTYFDETSSKEVEPDMELFQKINEKIDKQENSVSKRKIPVWKIAVSVAAIIVIALVSILVPVLLKRDEDKFYLYTIDDVNKVSLSRDFAKDYIDTNFSKYSFIFESCEFGKADGNYTKDKNELVMINLRLDEKNFPYSIVKIDLVVNSRFKYPDDEFYKANSKITDNGKRILYKKVVDGISSKVIYGLLDYGDYRIYLNINENNEDLFNKFL